jgi:predicted  nucleic acid-binding Zn-ribbon protein
MGTALARERTATGVTTKQQERQRVVASYRAAKKVYQEATAHLVQLEDAKAQAKSDIEQCKANMQGLDAGWLYVVTGKNETERKANLQLFRNDSEEYRSLVEAVANAERHVASLEPEIGRVMWEIKGTRYEIEMCIAEGLMIASEKDDERHG